MPSPLAQKIIDGLPQLGEADQAMLSLMLTYFDRSSLWVSKVEGAETDNPVFRFANEAEAYELDLNSISTLHDDLKAGKPIPWETLPKIR